VSLISKGADFGLSAAVSEPAFSLERELPKVRSNYAPRVLFVNGVNTAFGGSGANASRNWLASVRRVSRKVTVFNSVPTFRYENFGLSLKFFLAVYFMPGTLFRFSRFPGLEILHKLSPFCAIWMIVARIRARPDLVVFSHHSMFLYSFLFCKRQRVFLVQDLLYTRARSLGFPRRLCAMLFRLEISLYRCAAKVTVLSEGERRILARFVDESVSLVSCLNSEVAERLGESTDSQSIALISDWRRTENCHGVVSFFSTEGRPGSSNEPTIVLYGLGIDCVRKAIDRAGIDLRYKFNYQGAYANLSDLSESVFLVPIYQGAGIKMKVLEALNAGRYVLGTPAAFLGLKRYRLRDISRVVRTPRDLVAPKIDRRIVRSCFRKYYFSCFKNLGDILASHFTETAG
jgi:hypothetical protein